MQPTAWLFTKDESAVRIEMRAAGERTELVVEGPGSAGRSYDFPSPGEAEAFRADYERQLVSEGYRLQARSERREQRRAGGPAGQERRRR
jgi:hypothetical protein